VRTHQIAAYTNVHPNTVRLYEDWHYISPVPRAANGYREYSALHLKQMQIARLVFRQEFIQNNLRKKATQIVKLSGHEQFKEALVSAGNYYAFLQQEYVYTIRTVETIEKLQQNNVLSETTYTHKQVAERLNLTEETIRKALFINHT
jgi:DNA-binding transcriptional MerR regulator